MTNTKHLLTIDQRSRILRLCDALESGHYEQGRGWLCVLEGITQRHCCLGVACDISGLGRWVDGCYKTADGSSEEDVLPVPVMMYFGFPYQQGVRFPQHLLPKATLATTPPAKLKRLAYLTSANDSGVSFQEISAFLRKWVDTECEVEA